GPRRDADRPGKRPNFPRGLRRRLGRRDALGRFGYRNSLYWSAMRLPHADARRHPRPPAAILERRDGEQPPARDHDAWRTGFACCDWRIVERLYLRWL